MASLVGTAHRLARARASCARLSTSCAATSCVARGPSSSAVSAEHTPAHRTSACCSTAPVRSAPKRRRRAATRMARCPTKARRVRALAVRCPPNCGHEHPSDRGPKQSQQNEWPQRQTMWLQPARRSMKTLQRGHWPASRPSHQRTSCAAGSSSHSVPGCHGALQSWHTEWPHEEHSRGRGPTRPFPCQRAPPKPRAPSTAVAMPSRGVSPIASLSVGYTSGSEAIATLPARHATAVPADTSSTQGRHTAPQPGCAHQRVSGSRSARCAATNASYRCSHASSSDAATSARLTSGQCRSPGMVPVAGHGSSITERSVMRTRRYCCQQGPQKVWPHVWRGAPAASRQMRHLGSSASAAAEAAAAAARVVGGSRRWHTGEREERRGMQWRGYSAIGTAIGTSTRCSRCWRTGEREERRGMQWRGYSAIGTAAQKASTSLLVFCARVLGFVNILPSRED